MNIWRNWVQCQRSWMNSVFCMWKSLSIDCRACITICRHVLIWLFIVSTWGCFNSARNPLDVPPWMYHATVPGYPPKRAQNVSITSLLRQNDAMAFWRNNDVIITSCVQDTFPGYGRPQHWNPATTVYTIEVLVTLWNPPHSLQVSRHDAGDIMAVHMPSPWLTCPRSGPRHTEYTPECHEGCRCHGTVRKSHSMTYQKRCDVVAPTIECITQLYHGLMTRDDAARALARIHLARSLTSSSVGHL